MSIIIFSRSVRSGKTTELQQWCDEISTTKNIGGILMPDINGRRQLLDIKAKELFDIECTDAANTKEPLVTVGKYHFYSAAFKKGNAIITETAPVVDLLIIDEAGKLELKGKGLHEGIRKTLEIEAYKNGDKVLLLVVRDNLYEEVVSFFNITEHSLVHQVNDIIQPPLSGSATADRVIE